MSIGMRSSSPGSSTASAIAQTAPAHLQPSPSARVVCSPAVLDARRSLEWRGAFVLSLASPLLVTVSLGSMASDLGPLLCLVWTVTALIGVVQCLMIAEFATRFPDKVGGVAAYTHEGLKDVSPVFGAVAAWSYWVGWVPGVAVNLTLAATYIKAAFWPQIDVLGLTLALVVCVYSLNYFGLRLNVWAAALLGLCAALPLLAIALAPFFEPTLWNSANFQLSRAPGESSDTSTTILLILKWMFVAVWSSYGAEMIGSVAGEMRQPRRDVPRALGFAAITTLLAFTVVPIVLIGVVGADHLAEDPLVVFLIASRHLFGDVGSTIVSLMLVAALVLSAQLFVICSSRALFQMGKDRIGLKAYVRTNRYGVPVGSIGWDAVITLSLLMIFSSNVVNVVAAANVGYLLVFVLMPIAYILVRSRTVDGRMPGLVTLVAVGILVFNLTLFIVGGIQWGPTVVGVGGLLVLAALPIYVCARRGSV